MATSSSVTEISKEEYVFLKRVSCIHYLLRFWKNTIGIRALVDLGSKINAMTSAYATKLGLKVRKTNIEAQKIDSSTLDNFKMVLADF